jgi:hypothetical protein
MGDAFNLNMKKFDISSIQQDAVVLCVGKRRSGKCLAKGSMVVAFDGTFVAVEHVRVGDYLLGDDGIPHKVLKLTHGISRMYSVTNKYNEKYIVNKDHVLSLSRDDGTVLDIPILDYIGLPSRMKRGLYEYRYAGPSVFPSDLEDYHNLLGNARPKKFSRGDYYVDLSPDCDFSRVKFLVNSHSGVLFTDALSRTVIRTSDSPRLKSRIKVCNCGVGEYYGFEIDSPSHRFMTEHFIVTHNSWLIRDIFYNKRTIPSGIVFSGTEEASPFFNEFIPDSFIHSEYNASLLEDIFNLQKQRIGRARDLGKSESGKLDSNNVFVVLDDMIHDAKTWKKDRQIQNIFFNGRHFNIFFVLASQYTNAIPPELRGNIDYVFIFNEPSVANRRKLWESYGGMISTFKHFCDILDQCTNGYECLVLKTAGFSNKIEERVFYYTAEAHKNFRVGHPQIWKYHDSRYDTRYAQSDDDPFDKKKRQARAKKLKVIVSKNGDIVGHALQ